jgi:hypothetical protein
MSRSTLILKRQKSGLNDNRSKANGQTFVRGSGECVPVPRYLVDQILPVGLIDQGAGVRGQGCQVFGRVSNGLRS